MNNDQYIWNYFKSSGLSDCGVAGLMGNLYKESNLQANNLQDCFNDSLGMTDTQYTIAVDNGTYTNFVHDKAGYGLAQHTYDPRKQNMLNFSRSVGLSIGDLNMQLEFIKIEMQNEFPALWRMLETTKNVYDAAAEVCINYERPAVNNIQDRFEVAKTFYEKFRNGSVPEVSMPNNGEALRNKLVNIAVSYLDCNEWDGSHRKIIDIYNSHPGSGAMGYGDPWCCAYASAMAISAGLTNIIPVSSNCDAMINKFKQMGCWVEDDGYTPGKGDYIFYDWDDDGIGDCVGSSDHVGIVVDVSGALIKVIEGNKSDAVKYRNIVVNSKYIRGYGTPRYGNDCGNNDGKSIDDIAKEVIAGKWGNGNIRKNRLIAAGYDYNEVQQKVHNILNGVPSTPSPSDDIIKIAKEVIAGKWGNNEDRKNRLTAAGYDYKAVQSTVNTMMSSNTPKEPSAPTEPQNNSQSISTYVVRKGDTLWNIAIKLLGYGPRYKEIKELNGLQSNLIKPGQVLKIPV